MGEVNCKKRVFGGRGESHQCLRMATKGEYCFQHHPDAVAKRCKESERKYHEKIERSPISRLYRCRDRCKELEAEVKRLRVWAANQKCKFPQANLSGGVCDKDCGDCIPCQARITLEGWE